MPRTARRHALLLLALLGGCRTRYYDEPVPDAATAPDLATSVSPDLAGCAPFAIATRVQVPLARLELVDFLPAQQAAVRVRADIAYRAGCDVPAGIDTQVSAMGCDGCTDVALTAWIWRSNEARCVGTATATRVLLLSDDIQVRGATRLSVHDAAMGGTLAISTTLRNAQPGTDCGGRALGGACERDCQCAAANAEARCIPVKRGATTFGVCGLPCDEDAACPSTAPACDTSGGGSPGWVCGTTDRPGCARDGDCPRGQTCATVVLGAAIPPVHVCQTPGQWPDTPAGCGCPSPCLAPNVCTLVGEDALGCVLPCSANYECPGHGGCGASCQQGRCVGNPC